jgi:hypothetical protein
MPSIQKIKKMPKPIWELELGETPWHRGHSLKSANCRRNDGCRVGKAGWGQLLKAEQIRRAKDDLGRVLLGRDVIYAERRLCGGLIGRFWESPSEPFTN